VTCWEREGFKGSGDVLCNLKMEGEDGKRSSRVKGKGELGFIGQHFFPNAGGNGKKEREERETNQRGGKRSSWGKMWRSKTKKKKKRERNRVAGDDENEKKGSIEKASDRMTRGEAKRWAIWDYQGQNIKRQSKTGTTRT